MMTPMFTAAVHVLRTAGVNDDLCCIFARRVLEQAYNRDLTDLAAWHLFDTSKPWSPVMAAVDAKLTVSWAIAPTTPPKGYWSLVQGWRGTPGAIDPETKKPYTGHTFLWLQVTDDDGLTLDSAEGRSPTDTLNGFRAWSSRIAEFKYGVAVAVLKPF